MVLIISSCETNWGNYNGYKMEYESAMDYYIVLDKIDTILENYPYYNKGTFVKYYNNDLTIDTFFIGNGSQVISSFVDADKSNFDSVFILVAQKPIKNICECNDSCFITMPSFDNKSYSRCKEALVKSTFYQYWIINKVKNAVYGPFNKKEYLQKRREIGVREELQLKGE